MGSLNLMESPKRTRIKVTFHSILFPSDPKTRYANSGNSIDRILSSFGIKEETWACLSIRMNGRKVSSFCYRDTVPEPGSHLSVLIAPTNIDNYALRTMVTLLSFAGGVAGSNLLGLSGPAGWIVRAGGLLLGMWLSTFIPVPPEEDNSVNSLNSLQNDINQNGVFPKVFGRIRYAPSCVAVPITSVDSTSQYITVLLVLGFKPLHIPVSEIKIGNIPISRLGGVEHQLYDGFYHFQNISLYNNQYTQLNPGFQLNYASQWTQVRGIGVGDDAQVHENVYEFKTAVNTMRFEVDFEFPEGLGNYSNNQFSGYNVDLQIRYRLVGSNGAWTNAIPSWSDDYLNRDFTTLTETKAFEFIVKTNEALEVVLAILEPIDFATHVISAKLVNWLMNKSTALSITVQDNLQNNGGLFTVDQLNALQDTEELVARFYNVVTRIHNTTDDLLAQLSPLNVTISGVIQILEILDTLQQVYTYIKLGYGPELNTFPIWARWLIQFQNNEDLFGEAPSGAFKIVNSTPTPGAFYTSVQQYVPAGQYQVQIRRVSRDQDDNSDIRDKVSVNSVRSVIDNYQNIPPIRKDIRPKLALLAMRVKATNQLSGSLDKITVMAYSPLEWHDGDDWRQAALYDDDSRPVYKNLAWICCDIIRKYPNPQPASDDLIDIEAWLDFAEHSFDNELYFSGVIADEMSIQEALEMVCSLGKATPIMRDGKYSVIVDKPHATNVDLITLTNANDFNGSKKMEDPPEAIAIPFKNPDKDWADDKFIVYNDGYGPNSTDVVEFEGFFSAKSTEVVKLTNIKAVSVISVYDRVTSSYINPFNFSIQHVVGDSYTNLINSQNNFGLEFLRYRIRLSIFTKVPSTVQDVNLRGIVDSHDVNSSEHTRICFKLGRYIIAANKLRSEALELTVGLRNLRIERGDRVDVQTDINLIGLQSGRLLEDPTESLGDIVSFKLNTTVPMLSSLSYAISVINRAGETYTYPVDSPVSDGYYDELTLVTPTAQPGTPLIAGDTFAFGKINAVTSEMIVKEVNYSSDLKAKLILVSHAPEVHDSDDDVIPPSDPNITNIPDPLSFRPEAPGIIDIITDERALLRSANGLLTPSIQFTIVPSIAVDSQIATIAIDSYEVQYRLTGFSNPDTIYTPVSEQLTPPIDRSMHTMEFRNLPRNQVVWWEVGVFNKSANKVTITPVTELAYYSVRVRAISSTGLASDWHEEQLILVLGKTAPPPDVRNFRYANDSLKWDYSAPIDFAGFKLKFTAGAIGSWESATDLHDGLVTNTSFDLIDADYGDKTILIKGVDVNGNESVTPAKLYLNIGSQPKEIELARYKSINHPSLPSVFVGELTNMSYVNDSLGARAYSNEQSKTAFYTKRGCAFYRKSIAGDSFGDEFYQTKYPRVEAFVNAAFGEDNYENEWYVVNSRPQIYLDAQIDHSGVDIEVEFKTDSIMLWPENMQDPLWPNPVASNDYWPVFNTWKAIAGKIDFPRVQIPLDGALLNYSFRIVGQPSFFQLTISKMDIVIAVKAKSETISSVEFTDTTTGTVIPYETSFDKIVSVLVDLVPGAPTPFNTAVSYKVFLGSGAQLSPRVLFYNAVGSAVQGLANITLIGY